MCEVEKGYKACYFWVYFCWFFNQYIISQYNANSESMSVVYLFYCIARNIPITVVGICFTQQIWRSGNTGLKVIRKKVWSTVSSLFRDFLQTEVSLHFDLCWHYGDMMQHTKRHKWETLLTTSEVFGVPSLCDEFPCGLVGQVNGGKRQRPSLFQNLSSDEHILSHLGSIHVPATHTHIFPRVIL